MAAKRAKARVPLRLDYRSSSETGSAKTSAAFHVSKQFTAETKQELDMQIKAHIVQVKEDVARDVANNLGTGTSGA